MPGALSAYDEEKVAPNDEYQCGTQNAYPVRPTEASDRGEWAYGQRHRVRHQPVAGTQAPTYRDCR
jgi:hypothetical protein